MCHKLLSMTHTYNIAGMTCSSCVMKVKSELLKLGDVTSVEVQLNEPQATISMSKHIPTKVLQDALKEAGDKYIISEADINLHYSKSETENTGVASYFPIILIFIYIISTSLIIQFSQGSFNLMDWMSHFMAGFFLVFSFFKIMNLKGFAEGYSTYDVIAKAMPAYGFVYPFIELALGIAFLTGYNLIVTNIVTLMVMSISSIGVIQSLMKKTQFQCACLGTIIKLPLSRVTLFEDLLMVLMSIIMLAAL